MVKPFSPVALKSKVDELLACESKAELVKPTQSCSKKPAGDLSLDFAFPPRPTSLVNIQQELSKPDPRLGYITEQITADITLSAAVLKIVNSPYYGLTNKVSSIMEAANLIGINRIQHLVMAETVKNSIRLPAGLEDFWEEISKSAVMGATMSKHLGFDANLSYLMGLFHDTGVPLMAAKYPDYVDSLRQFHNETEELCEVEKRNFNMCHAMLGGLLARSWFLPAPLIEAIRLHHSLELFNLKLDSTVLEIIAIHWIADHLAGRLKGNIDTHFLLLEHQLREYLMLTNDTVYQGLIDAAMDAIDAE